MTDVHQRFIRHRRLNAQVCKHAMCTDITLRSAFSFSASASLNLVASSSALVLPSSDARRSACCE